MSTINSATLAIISTINSEMALIITIVDISTIETATIIAEIEEVLLTIANNRDLTIIILTIVIIITGIESKTGISKLIAIRNSTLIQTSNSRFITIRAIRGVTIICLDNRQ